MAHIPDNQKRDSFGSKFGVVAAAAGSAVGLGNIWKFPYITGVYGGGAFIVVYVVFIAAIGLTVMLSELIIGRRSGRNSFGAFKKLAPNTGWKYIGFLGIAAAFMILSFYGVVAGWSLEYIVLSISNGFSSKSPDELNGIFLQLIENPVRPIIFQLMFMALTAGIVIVGIKKGIEGSTKVLMPLLVVILIILCVKSVSLPGASAGLEFLFKPDFSKLTSDGILSALGHAFFSLSLGMGTIVTYGSYIDRKNNIINTAVKVTVADTVIAILAGIAIFPAVFAYGIEPSSGPGLVFMTLPNVFQQMTGGYIFSILFFILLSVAALTSSISILEVVVAYFIEELKMKRIKATAWAAILISILGVFCSLSMGVWEGFKVLKLNFFDLLDWTSANILLPLGGVFICLFVGWFMGGKKAYHELKKGSGLSKNVFRIFWFLVRFIAPVAIALVFMNGLGLIKL